MPITASCSAASHPVTRRLGAGGAPPGRCLASRLAATLLAGAATATLAGLAVAQPAAAAPAQAVPAQPAPAELVLRLAGPASGARLLAGWAPGLSAAAHVLIRYTTTATPAAAAGLLAAGQVDATVGDPPGTGLSGVLLAPLAVTGTAIVADITDPRTHRPVAGLRVDAGLLADLYTGRTVLAASRLRALNPSLALPARLVGLTAAGDGEQTRRLTGYLTIAAPARWTAGAVDELPAPPGGKVQVLAGAPAVGAELSAAPPVGVGYLGYLDVATATAAGLPDAAVVAADGGSSTPTPAALALGAAGLPHSPTAAGGGYPLTGLDTLTVAPAARVGPATGALRLLLDYADRAGQTRLPAGLPPLPAPLAAQSAAAAGRLQPAVAPQPSPPSPSPPAQASRPKRTPAAGQPSSLPTSSPVTPAPAVRGLPHPAAGRTAHPGRPGVSALPWSWEALALPSRTVTRPLPAGEVPTPGGSSPQWMGAAVADPLSFDAPVAGSGTTASQGPLTAPPPLLAPLLAPPSMSAPATLPTPGGLALAARTAGRWGPPVNIALVGVLLLAFAAAASHGRRQPEH